MQELPAALGSLPVLAHVDARNNQLAALPGTLGDAASLLELRLGFNQLTSLPASIGLLRSLKTLDLRNNLIEVRCCRHTLLVYIGPTAVQMLWSCALDPLPWQPSGISVQHSRVSLCERVCHSCTTPY